VEVMRANFVVGWESWLLVRRGRGCRLGLGRRFWRFVGRKGLRRVRDVVNGLLLGRLML
jgi:hypothetical protein